MSKELSQNGIIYLQNVFAGNRECELNREKNQDFLSLVGNQINISCRCGEAGYEWSARYGLCVDVNECATGEHSCSMDEGETCWNMPGGYECVCKFGYTYDEEQRACVVSPEVDLVLAGWKEEENVTEEKNIIEMIVKTLARAAANRPVIDRPILFTVIVVPRLLSFREIAIFRAFYPFLVGHRV